jgi:hypothetical protein
MSRKALVDLCNTKALMLTLRVVCDCMEVDGWIIMNAAAVGIVMKILPQQKHSDSKTK